MRKPPSHPTSLRPQGITITLPKPTLIVDSMEQKAYTFKPFRKWFAEIERRKLPIGDYSIAGPIVNETRCFPGERTLSPATLRLGFLKRA